jgi:hypothetical protein
MTLVWLGRVAWIQPFRGRLLFAFGGHFLNRKRLTRDAAVPEMGARNFIFCRTLVLGPGRNVHVCSPKNAGKEIGATISTDIFKVYQISALLVRGIIEASNQVMHPGSRRLPNVIGRAG